MRSMTVKLKENLSRNVLDNVLKNTGIKIVRENELGYIDLELSENKKFYEWHDHLTKMGIFETAEMNSFGKIFSDDPYYSQQYYLFNNNDYPLIYLRYDFGWYVEDGSSNPITVAVLDLGVDFRNLDLNYDQNNMGWDYIDGGDPLPNNNDNHGTGIAGIIGAVRNNNQAIAGVAGGNYDVGAQKNGAKIMALRIGPDPDPNNDITGAVVDDAIMYAVNNGAKVINMSFGVAENSAINNAITYAFNNNCFLVAASHDGKEGMGGTYPEIPAPLPYPANNSKVIAVGGITKTFEPHSLTNDIPVDLCAPSKQIISLKNTNGTPGYPVYTTNGGYSGTSFAAPQVAGTAALLYSYNPNFIHLDIKNIILSTANHDFTVYNSDDYGQGILNVGHLLDLLDNEYLQARIPQNINIINSNGKPKITWNSVNQADKYIIYRSYTHQRYGFNKVGETTNTNFTDYNLVPKLGITYYYRVASFIDDSGESITSTEKTFSIANPIEKNADNLIKKSDNFIYGLKENYPNPFNPTTTIKYSIKEDGIVNLSIYNVLGEMIEQPVNQYKEKGNYSINFNASNLSSGVYFYKISVNKYSAIKKMVVTK